MLVTVGMLAAACAQDAPQATADPEFSLSGDAIREHMRTLSSDEYMGRGPGQAGGDMAVAYVAARFQEFGLEPVNGSYVQSVPMIGYTTDPGTVTLSFTGPRGNLSASYLDGFVLNAGNPQATAASGSG